MSIGTRSEARGRIVRESVDTLSQESDRGRDSDSGSSSSLVRVQERTAAHSQSQSHQESQAEETPAGQGLIQARFCVCLGSAHLEYVDLAKGRNVGRHFSPSLHLTDLSGYVSTGQRTELCLLLPTATSSERKRWSMPSERDRPICSNDLNANLELPGQLPFG